jgi:hypothetical protein
MDDGTVVQIADAIVYTPARSTVPVQYRDPQF